MSASTTTREYGESGRSGKSGKSGKSGPVTPSRKIRDKLSHPVIDTDGHLLEVTEVYLDYIREAGGADMVERYLRVPSMHAFHSNNGMYFGGVGPAKRLTLEDRRKSWSHAPGFWTLPTGNTLDRATGMLPSLMSARLDDMGIDVSILFPTQGLQAQSIVEDDLRLCVTRALNRYYADLLGPYADRLLPVALIPMNTPQEAIAELEHAVKTLGYRAVVMQAWASRPIEQMASRYPELKDHFQRPDLFALDSAYDYDPVWAKCVELGVAPTFHGIGTGPGVGRRGSISTHMFNNSVIGGFAASAQDICGAILFGGVTRRFPTLNFGFMEGGSAWAIGLLSRLVERWEKRNGHAMREMLDPAVLNREMLRALMLKHGDARTVKATDAFMSAVSKTIPEPDRIDDFDAIGMQTEEDAGARFIDRFYFGCEADDPTVGLAFHSNALPLGRPLNAILGSDISHWDVTDMTTVVAEAWHAVERGGMTESDFRDFVFCNPVRLHAGMNRNFFKSTRAEAAVEKLLTGNAGR